MDNLDKKELEMTFDPNTIAHLGIQMYSTLPPVIAELVSNSYDADAHNVTIKLNDSDSNNKFIEIFDDGHGMTFNEINDCFLLIGRNRRGFLENNQYTRSKKRLVIGKKGIGKLSFFGIARTITISTIANGIKNSFIMDWDDLRNSKNVYKPKIIEKNMKTSFNNGTTITLSNINRKSAFQPKNIAIQLAKTFSIFDDTFKVVINYNENTEINVDSKLRFDNLKTFKEWNFPLQSTDVESLNSYEHKDKIFGKIIASENTIPETMRGIALFSRGKLVNEFSFFDVKATSFGYSYLTGWLDVNFIDEWIPDVISTNRQSLNWEDERCTDLKVYLENAIEYVYKQRRDAIDVAKKINIKQKTGIDIDVWVEKLPKHEQKLAKKLVNSVISNDGIENDKASELIGFIKDSFQYTAFKELATEMEDKNISNTELLSLFKEWKIIESREMYKLAEVRVQTIKKFQENIDNDVKEVPIMHNFFVQFPWLLDPRIMNFKDEVRFSTLLREKFNESTIPESDRRLDFLCHNFVGQLFIIELKRPSKVLSSKELDQALEYVDFIQKHLGNDTINKVSCYLIGKKLSDDSKVKLKADSYRQNGVVIVRTYDELLSAAMKYNSEFIEKYKEINNIS